MEPLAVVADPRINKLCVVNAADVLRRWGTLLQPLLKSFVKPGVSSCHLCVKRRVVTNLEPSQFLKVSPRANKSVNLMHMKPAPDGGSRASRPANRLRMGMLICLLPCAQPA